MTREKTTNFVLSKRLGGGGNCVEKIFLKSCWRGRGIFSFGDSLFFSQNAYSRNLHVKGSKIDSRVKRLNYLTQRLEAVLRGSACKIEASQSLDDGCKCILWFWKPSRTHLEAHTAIVGSCVGRIAFRGSKGL